MNTHTVPIFETVLSESSHQLADGTSSFAGGDGGRGIEGIDEDLKQEMLALGCAYKVGYTIW